MTADRLEALRRAAAFDFAPARRDLHEFHVPFDELIDGTHAGSGPWEGDLQTALLDGGRVPVIGPSGTGKSSLIGYVLGPLREQLAPIPVAVRHASTTDMTDLTAFTMHLVKQIHRTVTSGQPHHASHADRVAGREGTRIRSFKARLPDWFSGAEIGTEIASVSQYVLENGSDYLRAVHDLLDLIRSADLMPVLVIDDTDKWINVGPETEDAYRRARFFDGIVRSLSEDIGCAAVIAVHPTYIDDPAYQAATDFLGRPIQIPQLRDVHAVDQVLAHRQELALGDALAQLWTPAAAAEAFGLYAQPPHATVRRLLQLAHMSLGEACTSGAELIDADHVSFAAQELGD